jgi:hypothetical protein
LRTQLTQVVRYITFDIVRKLEFICTQKKSYNDENDEKTCVNANREELQLLNHSLNFVPHILDSDHSDEKNISQIGQSCEKLIIMQTVRQVKIMVSKENFKLLSQQKKTCQYCALLYVVK